MPLLVVLLILAAILFGVGFAVKGALLICLILAGCLVVGAITRGVSGRRSGAGV